VTSHQQRTEIEGEGWEYEENCPKKQKIRESRLQKEGKYNAPSLEILGLLLPTEKL
jgi:hypothetical protein